MAGAPSDRQTIDLADSERRLVEAINQYRAGKGLPELAVDSQLTEIARKRVSVFNHHHPRYGWCKEHTLREGFPGFTTDNLAQGHPTPESVVGDDTTGWGMDEAHGGVGHDWQMRGFAKFDGEWRDMGFNVVGVAHQGSNDIAIFGTRP